MANKKTIGITALILLLAGTSSIVLFQNIDFNKTQYYCETNSALGPVNCDRFSSTGLRCYPTAGTTKGYKDCSVSWTEIIQETTTSTTTISTSTSTTTSIEEIKKVQNIEACSDICRRQ